MEARRNVLPPKSTSSLPGSFVLPSHSTTGSSPPVVVVPEGFVVVAPDEEVVPSVPAAPPVVVVPAALPFVVVPSVDLPESVVVTPGSFVHATESIITPASIATAKRSVIILFIDIISFLDFFVAQNNQVGTDIFFDRAFIIFYHSTVILSIDISLIHNNFIYI